MKRTAVLHPFFLGAFSILFLYAQNAAEMRFGEVIIPLMVTWIVTALVMFPLTRALGSSQQAGFAVSALVMAFFSYGYMFDSLEVLSELTGFSTVANRVLILVGATLIFLAVFGLVRALGENIVQMSALLNFVAGGLIVVQLLTIGSTLLDRRKSQVAASFEEEFTESSSRNPDIFFIVLDGYGRQDVLQDLYAHDNGPFLESLESLGFEVAADSRAPYAQTFLSLASIFNLDYLESFASLSPDSDDRVQLAESIWDGVAIQTLKQQGYSTVSFASGYYLTEFENADRYLAPGQSMGEFSRLLVHTTALRLFEDSNVQASRFRSRIEYTLRSLDKLGATETPTFVMAHVVAPHPPFVLGRELDAIPEGEPIHFNDGTDRIRTQEQREQYVDLYREQLRALNELVEEAVSGLVARPEDDRPVIVIASDHGPGSELRNHSLKETDLRERFGSLFAVCLPNGKSNDVLPDPMTPVNAFRLIFNRYLETDYPLLPSRSFFSAWDRPFDLIEIDDQQLELRSKQDG